MHVVPAFGDKVIASKVILPFWCAQVTAEQLLAVNAAMQIFKPPRKFLNLKIGLFFGSFFIFIVIFKS